MYFLIIAAQPPQLSLVQSGTREPSHRSEVLVAAGIAWSVSTRVLAIGVGIWGAISLAKMVGQWIIERGIAELFRPRMATAAVAA